MKVQRPEHLSKSNSKFMQNSYRKNEPQSLPNRPKWASTNGVKFNALQSSNRSRTIELKSAKGRQNDFGYLLKVDSGSPPHASLNKGSRHALGPQARRISIIIFLYSALLLRSPLPLLLWASLCKAPVTLPGLCNAPARALGDISTCPAAPSRYSNLSGDQKSCSNMGCNKREYKSNMDPTREPKSRKIQKEQTNSTSYDKNNGVRVQGGHQLSARGPKAPEVFKDAVNVPLHELHAFEFHFFFE